MTGDGTDLALQPPVELGRWRPTGYMENVSRFVEANPGAGVTEIRSTVRGPQAHRHRD